MWFFYHVLRLAISMADVLAKQGVDSLSMGGPIYVIVLCGVYLFCGLSSVMVS